MNEEQSFRFRIPLGLGLAAALFAGPRRGARQTAPAEPPADAPACGRARARAGAAAGRDARGARRRAALPPGSPPTLSIRRSGFRRLPATPTALPAVVAGQRAGLRRRSRSGRRSTTRGRRTRRCRPRLARPLLEGDRRNRAAPRPCDRAVRAYAQTLDRRASRRSGPRRGSRRPRPSVERAQALFDEGRTTEIDVERARLQAARAKQKLLNAESDRDLDGLELKRLIGWPGLRAFEALERDRDGPRRDLGLRTISRRRARRIRS